jgi:hypothetical protein
LSEKKKDFKKLTDDDLVFSKDMLGDDDDGEINWWEILNDSAPHDYGNDDYYDEDDHCDEYDIKDQDWVRGWIKNN